MSEHACAVGDLAPGEAMRTEVDGVAVAVVRDEAGGYHAIGDACTHGNVSLSDGEVEGATIECWLHGSTFDLRTGRPLSLPATKPVPVYLVTVEGEDVLVDATTVTNDQ
ncbi:MAG: non-heme iron oxygenase ferredoxin subunit [Actinomycetes bacterium]|nr:non-heme iron oxygenase ferredoxin subunit [Actinomycetes bacterium]MDX5380235.1 non-heme iron oxygenase ferredoxin subunit [Actinomycetes bacterium]MDX5398931.1 non-heme iron oxygenase ferredoxin subunit [Actinomycetes bacterium]MDX5449964.1 non-heme iron oxygenase ferredoxin subunit [Actinomycetes bacterium]